MATQVFLLTDIEGSTRRWAEHPAAMRISLARHDELLAGAITTGGGTVFKHTGDGLMATFPSASSAVEAAVAIQRAVSAEDWRDSVEIRVRVAVHAGEAEARGEDWFGPALNRCTRLLGVTHAGQIVVSNAIHALTTDSPRGDIEFRDLGLHPLRDLVQPEHAWQVVANGLATDFPPLRTLGERRGNLPTQLTEFVGRVADVADLVSAVTSGRLVTLVGAGGMGKTRLALQVAAAAVDEFPDGAWLVELGPLVSAESIDHTLMTALAVNAQRDLSHRTSLLQALQNWRALLVVDNCEHVLSNAAEVVRDLLIGAPGINILATSREPLHLAGERVWHVQPLHFETDAVELFNTRASASRRDFILSDSVRPLVATICRRLDGMPLAIELAAARIRSMSSQELAERLDERFRLLRGNPMRGVPVRHWTLEAVVEWSFDLLSPAEQDVAGRLSAFPGSFDLRAAHAISSTHGDEIETLEALDALVDKCLVIADHGEAHTRYRLLETIRQYGLARLDAAVLEETRHRHANFYAELVKRYAALRPDEGELRNEIDNLRAAIAYAIERQNVTLALSIVGRVATYASRQTTMLEAESWALSALDLRGAEESPDAVWAHFLIASIRNLLADDVGNEHHSRQAIAIERRLGLPPHPRLRIMLAEGLAWQAKVDAAMSFAREALELAREQEHVNYQINAMSQLICFSVFFQHAPDPTLVKDCLSLAERSGAPIAIHAAAYGAGMRAAADDPESAVEHFWRVEEMGQRAGVRNHRMGIARAFIPLFDQSLSPSQALSGLVDGLEFFRRAGATFALRRLVRDFLPPFAALRRYETVATVDGAADRYSARPRLVANAIEEARAALGGARYREAFQSGARMSDAALEQYLLGELEVLAELPHGETTRM